LAACATGGPQPPPSPARIPGLEARVRSDPGDIDARTRLASAYVQTERAQEAVTLLEPIVDPGPAPAEAGFFLGLAYEKLGRLADARREYTQYLEAGATDDMRRRLRARLVWLDRLELEQAVRLAIQQEQALAAREPPPRTLGVFPFLTGLGESMRPLGVAFAELLSSDLAETDRLTVVERSQLQFLLNELALADSGVVDPRTAARAGRLLGAGRLVQGRLDGTETALRVQAFVVPATASPDLDTSPVTQQGALADLFTVQAEVALAIYDRIGITLTVAERERVMRRPTQNVQALLAFGFGLEDEDAARYRSAITNHERAVELDPGFQEATEALERARALAEASEDTPDDLAMDFTFGRSLWVVRRERFAGVDEMIPDPGIRDPIWEILGVEGLLRRAFIDLRIGRPGGNQ
jgi:tetratricopeptide (TPR) repeat protein